MSFVRYAFDTFLLVLTRTMESGSGGRPAHAQAIIAGDKQPCQTVYWFCITALFFSLLISVTNAQAQQESSTSTDPLDAATIISREVIVEPGDTLISIANREMGRAGFAPMLADFNSLTASAPLVEGSTIRIPIYVPGRGEFAEVLFVKGTVTVQRASTQTQSDTTLPVIALSRNDQILSGDTITTADDGYASIAFSNGSIVNLQPGTTATLQRLNCLATDDSCLIELLTEQGEVKSNVIRHDGQPMEFKINTPYASAAVRGTMFDFDASDNLKLGVTEGEVAISAEAQTRDLGTGFGLVVEPGQAPPEPVALLSAPVFKRVPPRMAVGDTVEWWALGNAAAYGARLSTDEQSNDLVEFMQVDSATIGFDSTASGDYYLTVRALDTNGLKGFTTNTRLTIASIDPALEPVTTAVTRQGREFLVSVQSGPDNANGYEIQLATEESFSDPLSIDVNSNGTAIFANDATRVFARARALIDPYTVSAFGPISSN
ncbi:MAG: FecR domain-containing protein [Granulosicoccus sp.]|nr:FecR domain-containing protein [Granulosicoccus sp.]